jgi:hypothetical protein
MPIERRWALSGIRSESSGDASSLIQCYKLYIYNTNMLLGAGLCRRVMQGSAAESPGREKGVAGRERLVFKLMAWGRAGRGGIYSTDGCESRLGWGIATRMRISTRMGDPGAGQGAIFHGWLWKLGRDKEGSDPVHWRYRLRAKDGRGENGIVSLQSGVGTALI